jgi:hypothetical protein
MQRRVAGNEEKKSAAPILPAHFIGPIRSERFPGYEEWSWAVKKKSLLQSSLP